MPINQKFEWIQVLRGVAAISVVIYHSHWASSYDEKSLFAVPFISQFGYMGVYLFFVISGFIICHIIQKKPNITQFLLRRFFRIYPLFWIVMLFVILSPAFSSERETLGFIGIIKSFIIFPQEEYPLLSPAWSLEHEIIFYTLIALMIYIKLEQAILPLLLILYIIGHLYSFDFYHIFSDTQIYFACGILSYRLRNLSMTFLLPSFIIIFTITLLGVYNKIELSSQINFVLFSISFAFLISIFSSDHLNTYAPPKFLTSLGDISYSMYIIHGPIFVYLSILGHSWNASPPELWRWLSIGVAIGCSFVTYKLIEQPLQKLGTKLNQ